MKKLLFFSIALFFSFIGVHATNSVCSDTTQNGDTVQFSYCVTDYYPRYNAAGYLIEEPVTFLIDLGQTAMYHVSGHIEFDQENGDAIRNSAFVKVANTETGAWDFVSEQTITE